MLEPLPTLVTNTTPLIALHAVRLQPFLENSLDRGEAAVIQTALTMGVPLERLRHHGNWLSAQVIQFAMPHA